MLHVACCAACCVACCMSCCMLHVARAAREDSRVGSLRHLVLVRVGHRARACQWALSASIAAAPSCWAPCRYQDYQYPSERYQHYQYPYQHYQYPFRALSALSITLMVGAGCECECSCTGWRLPEMGARCEGADERARELVPVPGGKVPPFPLTPFPLTPFPLTPFPLTPIPAYAIST